MAFKRVAGYIAVILWCLLETNGNASISRSGIIVGYYNADGTSTSIALAWRGLGWQWHGEGGWLVWWRRA